MRDTPRKRLKRGLAILGACAIISGMAVAGQAQAPAAEALKLDLPTWEDVQAAKNNQASADKKVAEIKGLLVESQKELDRRRNMHATTVDELNQAENALTVASDTAQTLETEAKKSREEADDAADRAGVLVAQMYRSGGVDRSMELFLDADGSTADALLGRMASMSKATERNSNLAEEATQTANTADTLGKQAEDAKVKREELRQVAKTKETEAATAMADQGALVTEQEQQQADLQLKLEALQDKTTETVDGYKKRQQLEAAEALRLKKLAEEAERQRLEELRKQQEQNNNNNNNGTNPPVTPPTKPPTTGTSNGWTYPVSNYWVSEGFRSPGRWDHTGIDLAASCGTPIVAAASGNVGLTYWDGGGGGNMVTVNHGNGWQTRYAHMISWAIVSNGQYVKAGQVLGYVGSTGASSGCHLHFEMRPNQDNGWYDFVNPAFYINF